MRHGVRILHDRNAVTFGDRGRHGRVEITEQAVHHHARGGHSIRQGADHDEIPDHL